MNFPSAAAELVAESALAAESCERFDFYGLRIEVRGSRPDVVNEIRRDFAYFSKPATLQPADVRIQLLFAPPPYHALPQMKAAVFTPRNVTYQDERTGTTYIDYFGRGLAIFNRKAGTFTGYGTDSDLMREMVYLFILSASGEYLDRNGLHRIHALGVSYENRGTLLMLPSGGGKSTMSLHLLRQDGFSLLGEDTPLIDRRGRILPFHLRLGVRLGNNPGIPEKHLKTVNRMEFDPKTLIDIDYFQDRLSPPVDPGFLLIGERNSGETSAIVPVPRRAAFKGLVKNMVVGLGIYQGLEFLLERSGWELVGKTGLAASRLQNSIHLLRRSSCYKFILGRDREKNCQTLVSFLRSQGRAA